MVRLVEPGASVFYWFWKKLNNQLSDKLDL